MDIRNFVYGYLGPFVWDVVHAVTDDVGVYYATFDFLHSLLDNDWTGIAVGLMYGPIAVWFTLKNAYSIILQNVGPVVDFVNNYVGPAWIWLIQSVNTFNDWLTGAASYVAGIVQAAIDNAFSVIQYLLNFLYTLYWSGRDVLIRFISNAWQFVADIAGPVANAILDPFRGYLAWLIALWTLGAQFLLTFLSDPIGFVVRLAAQVFDALIAPFKPVIDFLNWWSRYGGDVLTRFVSDPAGFTLEMIAPRFVDWLLHEIADRW